MSLVRVLSQLAFAGIVLASACRPCRGGPGNAGGVAGVGNQAFVSLERKPK